MDAAVDRLLGRRSPRASAWPSTATTTSTASPPRSSSAGRSNCSAPTSCTSCPSGCGTATASTRRRSSASHADGVRVIVSVDCGIRGMDAAVRARELGVDLIVTDHHEPDAELPQALAVINPKRRDCALSRQAAGGRRRGVEARAGALPARGQGPVAAGLSQAGGDRHAGRRRAAAGREPRHRQARPRLAVARPAQGRPPGADRSVGPHGKDHRRLPRVVHASRRA